MIAAKNSLKEHLLNLQKKDPTQQGPSSDTESLITVSDDHDALTPTAFHETVLKAISRASPKSLIAIITGSKKTLLRVESAQEAKARLVSASRPEVDCLPGSSDQVSFHLALYEAEAAEILLPMTVFTLANLRYLEDEHHIKKVRTLKKMGDDEKTKRFFINPSHTI